MVLSAQASPAKDKNPCLKCHAAIKKSGKNIHAAIEIGCNQCHVKVDERSHPVLNNSIRLKKEMPGLCYGCHEESEFKGKHVHQPFAEGKCTVCHKPHGSNFQKLLTNNPPDFCYVCHDKTKFTKKYVHMVAIGKRCNCHDAHVSQRPQLLRTAVSELCIGCHKSKGTGRHVVSSLPRGRIHPIEGVPDPKNPKEMMTCASCHNPHSSDYPKLFTAKRICKRCHQYF